MSPVERGTLAVGSPIVGDGVTVTEEMVEAAIDTLTDPDAPHGHLLEAGCAAAGYVHPDEGARDRMIAALQAALAQSPAPTRDTDDDGLVGQLRAAIDAWHDTAPQGQGESWADDADEKRNAMCQLFYDNSEQIIAALSCSTDDVRAQIADALERRALELVLAELMVWDSPMQLEKISVRTGKAAGLFEAVKVVRSPSQETGGDCGQ